LEVGRKNKGGDFLGVLRGEGWAFVGSHFPGDAEDRGLSHLEVEVGGPAFNDGGEQIVEVRGGKAVHK
jgi:hypothetical protein